MYTTTFMWLPTSSRSSVAMERLQSDACKDAATVAWSDGTDVTAMLAELPRQQRLAMALFYVEGLSVAEVASTLEISEGAVKLHLNRGRDRLRGVFDAHQEADR